MQKFCSNSLHWFIVMMYCNIFTTFNHLGRIILSLLTDISVQGDCNRSVSSRNDRVHEMLGQFSHSEPWNQSVSGSYNFMETNSLLMESGEKYVVLISKQYVKFLGHGEHSSGHVHVFRYVFLCILFMLHIYLPIWKIMGCLVFLIYCFKIFVL